MLEDSLFESQGAKKTRKPVTVVVAAVAHAVAIGVLILIPLLQTQALTLPPINLSLLAPRMEMRAVDVTLVHSARPHIQKQLTPPPGVLTAPEAIPPRIVIETDPAPPNLGFFLPSKGTGGSIVSGLLTREADDLALGPPPAPVSAPLPPPPPIEKVSPVRRGGEVQAANLIHQVNPVYPQLARQTHVQGVVVLEAVINK